MTRPKPSGCRKLSNSSSLLSGHGSGHREPQRARSFIALPRPRFLLVAHPGTAACRERCPLIGRKRTLNKPVLVPFRNVCSAFAMRRYRICPLQRNWRWRQSLANPSPSRNSLFRGKIQGNLPLEAGDARSSPRITEQIQSVPSEFPKNRSREFR